jgi:hypothetical protein
LLNAPTREVHLIRIVDQRDICQSVARWQKRRAYCHVLIRCCRVHAIRASAAAVFPTSSRSAPTLFVWPLSFVIARKCTIRRIVLASLNYS